MRKKNALEDIVQKIFKAKKKYHKKMAKLPIEEKIKILVELQKLGVEANKKMKNKKVWDI